MKMTIQNMTLELPDKLTSMSVYMTDPFIIFEQKGVLDALSYSDLADEMYSLDDFTHQYSKGGNKRRKTITPQNIAELQSGPLKNICHAFFSDVFFKWFTDTHLHFFEPPTVRPKKLHLSPLLIRVFQRLRILVPQCYKFYQVEVEYSSISQNCFIPPHTDSKNKRLSLILYLNDPQKKQLDERLQKDLGTTFWSKKASASRELRAFDSSFIQNADRIEFEENYEPCHVSRYEPNKIVGFIKSDVSWHSVEPIKSNYDRRALVINVYEV
jgi:hypothetical protein